MPPRLNIFRASALTFRPKAPIARTNGLPTFLQQLSRRSITSDEKPSPAAKQPKGPNQDHLPHVSEEAAAIGKITGEGGPDIEQGTPVEEILKRDKDAQAKAPQILKDQLNANSKPSGSRSFSTSARRPLEALAVADSSELERVGHKFPIPAIPLPRTENIKHRYNEVVDQVTKMLMRHGKLATAQKNMTEILNQLRTAQPPQLNPGRPLLPDAPPSPQLPLNPVQYLTFAIDSVAPLVRIRNQKGAAGGGMALQIPQPLNLRQRRRTAMKWILVAAGKRRDAKLSERVAAEVIAVVEGRSSVWERKQAIHKQATVSRANVRWRAQKGR